MSDHPLNIYKDYFETLKIKSYSSFMDDNESNTYVTGTIMAI